MKIYIIDNVRNKDEAIINEACNSFVDTLSKGFVIGYFGDYLRKNYKYNIVYNKKINEFFSELKNILDAYSYRTLLFSEVDDALTDDEFINNINLYDKNKKYTFMISLREIDPTRPITLFIEDTPDNIYDFIIKLIRFFTNITEYPLVTDIYTLLLSKLETPVFMIYNNEIVYNKLKIIDHNKYKIYTSKNKEN